MVPVHCRVKHDPDNGTYGDCVRACIASILEIERPEAVPHFFADDCDGVTGNGRIVEYLLQHGLAPFYCSYDGNISLEDILNLMGEQNPVVHYMLFGRTIAGSHVVVCRGNMIVHDPAWYSSRLIGCNETGYWSIMVLAKI